MLHRLAEMQSRQLEVVVRFEGRNSASQLVNHATQAVEIGGGVDTFVLAKNLGRGVAIVVRASLRNKAVGQHGQGHVTQDHPVVAAQKNVRGLDGPVEQPFRMHGLERLQELADDGHDLLGRVIAAQFQKTLQRDTVHISRAPRNRDHGPARTPAPES